VSANKPKKAPEGDYPVGYARPPNRLATTVQGPATGKGAHFIIVDDPFKAAEAASDTTRNGVFD
jgi:hypothetical protein